MPNAFGFSGCSHGTCVLPPSTGAGKGVEDRDARTVKKAERLLPLKTAPVALRLSTLAMINHAGDEIC